MKKTVCILIAILAVVYAGLSLLGSGKEYEAEKIFYRAMKVSAKITANPDVIPPKLVESVEADFKKILKLYPKTNIAKGTHVTLAEFYIFNKQYSEALITLEAIIKANAGAPAMLSTAHFLKGQVYEKQDKWALALNQYAIIQKDYAETQLGVEIPLYIAKYYTTKNKAAEARQAYTDAARFYQELESKNSKKMLGYIASTLLMQSYMGLEDYEQAGKVLEDTLNNYRSGATLAQLLPQVENIFVIKLNRKWKAIEIYKNVQEKVQDKLFKKFLDEKIAALSK